MFNFKFIMDHKAYCDVCRKRIFDDYRYKCLFCHDYDLCSECFEGEKFNQNHSKGHPVVRFDEPNVLFGKERPNSSREVTLESLKREYMGESHVNFQCDDCGQNPIKGLRFSSYNRKRHNRCFSCFMREPSNELVVVFGKLFFKLRVTKS